jgi:tRNA (guanine-N7-)-methyltransferase
MGRLRKTSKNWRSSERPRALLDCEDYFLIEPGSLFVREAPLEVELGAGRGEFILGRAAAMPERNFLAVELSLPLAQLLARRAGDLNLHNLLIVRADARSMVNLFLPSACVSAYHIYFPDPWPKARHFKRRLFSPLFVANLCRTLVPGGLLKVATDVHEYAESIFAMVGSQGLNAFKPSALPPSSFARKFIAAGRPIYFRVFAKPANSVAKGSKARNH